MTARSNKAAKSNHGLRRQMITHSLLTEVFQGRLRPGQRLVTQELAQRFGFSHTPIREALIELAGIGIIDLRPNRGAVVRRVTCKEVREIYQVRRVLECEATRRACGRISLVDLHELVADLEHLRANSAPPLAKYIQEARRVDSRLHDLVAESCGNAFLAQELGRLKTLFRAFRDIAWEQDAARNDAHRVLGEADEHLEIVGHLLAGEARQASRAMARHIHSGGKYWSRAMPASAVSEPASQPKHRRRSIANGN